MSKTKDRGCLPVTLSALIPARGTGTENRREGHKPLITLALVYSWMRPPSRSRRHTGPAFAADSARLVGLIGVANARPRCGLSRLYLHENAQQGRLNGKRIFTYGPDTGMRASGEPGRAGRRDTMGREPAVVI